MRTYILAAIVTIGFFYPIFKVWHAFSRGKKDLSFWETATTSAIGWLGVWALLLMYQH